MKMKKKRKHMAARTKRGRRTSERYAPSISLSSNKSAPYGRRGRPRQQKVSRNLLLADRLRVETRSIKHAWQSSLRATCHSDRTLVHVDVRAHVCHGEQIRERL